MGHKRIRSNHRIARLLLAVACLVMSTASGSGCKQRGDNDADRVSTVFGGAGVSPGLFSYPRAIAISPVDGAVYVVDKTARVQRFSADGRYEHHWRMPQWEDGKPVGLFVDKQDRVWVPDTHYSRIIVYDRDGHELFRFGERGTGPGQFIFPTSIAIDRHGNIFVGEYGENDRINKFSPERQYLFSFADATTGDASVTRPTELVIDENDVLWVADACHHRICRYDLDGKLLSSFGVPGTSGSGLSYPYGLVLTEDGSVLVADHGNNRLVRFNRAGKYLDSWGSPGRSIGQLSQPWDLALGRQGRVYALDSWNNRVQVVEW